ncbi:MAG TPA: carbohydrate ABC transporter permease [Chloroflexia bacterium]|nr:carbohydrate ABC transporter permease [Chloroflexia bacterium]
MSSRADNRRVTQQDVDQGFSRWISDMSNVAHHLLTIGAAALFIIPLLWMVGASLRQPGLAPPTQLEWIPNPIVLDNYYKVATDLIPFGTFLANSLKVVAVAVPVTVITASWAGFAMAQITPRPRGWLILASVAALMVPVTVLWLTRFLVYKWIGALDSLWALILPSFMGTSPFYVLLFYWTFSRVSSDLYESARLDGASAFRVWFSIALPLSRPAITAVAVLTFVAYWSNYIDPLLYLSSQKDFTLPVGLQALQQMPAIGFPLLLTGAVMITVPVVVMFVIAQRYFLQDLRGAGWLGR